MSRHIMTLFFLSIVLSVAKAQNKDTHERDLIRALEKKMEDKFFEYANDVVKWLENINYKNLNNSDLGKIIGYNEIKPKLDNIGTEARGMKMISMALIPIIFHIGVTSTWIMLTAFLAAKSVAIGLILLAFKIAVSSVKIASFITAWKIKKHHNELAWPLYHDHHAIHNDHHSHIPEYSSHHFHSPDFDSHHSHTPDFSSHHAHTPDFNSHHSHTSDYKSHHTHTPDLSSRNSYKPDWTHSTTYKAHPPTFPPLEIEYVESKKADKRLG